ncbi:hypothetical protein H4R34_005614 [Dimargaris verticillata]|uniref:Uncharacterized protein n=1 Tax=Dimargaris verticillata TaxID=2761393 RepID=A0A9W8E609_9FUNG|nr:hypothetical protein H4R34_005614 [Dimargaris verticillata]
MSSMSASPASGSGASSPNGPRTKASRVSIRCHKIARATREDIAHTVAHIFAAYGKGHQADPTATLRHTMSAASDDNTEAQHDVVASFSAVLGANRPKLNAFDVVGDAIYQEITDMVNDLVAEFETYVNEEEGNIAQSQASGNSVDVNDDDDDQIVAQLEAHLRSKEKEIKAKVHGLHEMWRELEALLMDESDLFDSAYSIQSMRRVVEQNKRDLRSTLMHNQQALQQATQTHRQLERQWQTERTQTTLDHLCHQWQTDSAALRRRWARKPPVSTRHRIFDPDQVAPTNASVHALIRTTAAGLRTMAQTRLDSTTDPIRPVGNEPNFILRPSAAPIDHCRSLTAWFRQCNQSLTRSE